MDIEIVTLIYALGEAIRVKDWASAGLMQERLLLLYSPLTTVLHNTVNHTPKENHGSEIRH